MTTAACVSAWLVASAVPFFDGLVEIIGSICVTSFFFPALFCRKAHRRAGGALALRAPEAAATALLMVAAVLLSISGEVGAVVGVSRDWRSYGRPFACHSDA